MPRRLILVSILVCASSWLVAQKPPEPDLASLPPELAELLLAFTGSPYQNSGSIGVSLGHRSNPGLSSFDAQGSVFVRGEIEGLCWRMPRKGWESILMLNGEIRRYASPPPSLSSDQQWFLHAEERWSAAKHVRVSLSAQGFYLDQILDISESEVSRTVLPLKVSGGILGMALRYSPCASFWADVQTALARSTYRDLAEDYLEPKQSILLHWKASETLGVELSTGIRRRGYDDRQIPNASGRLLTGTRLHFLQKELVLGGTYAWKAAYSCSLGLRAKLLTNRDESSGFFDYDQVGGELSFAWERDPWEIEATLGAGHYRYLLQTVGAGLEPPHRRRDDRSISAAVARKIGESWSLRFEFSFDRSRTNLEDSDYDDYSLLAGLRRNF